LITGAIALPAQADSVDSRVVSVQLTNRPDSGEDGNDWAHDDMRRQIKITETSPGIYAVTVHDVGKDCEGSAPFVERCGRQRLAY
jgi:hypothetical protein